MARHSEKGRNSIFSNFQEEQNNDGNLNSNSVLIYKILVCIIFYHQLADSIYYVIGFLKISHDHVFLTRYDF